MRFEIVQHFDSPAEKVQAAYLDPAFLEEIGRLPRLGAPDLLEERAEGEIVHRRIRYRFAGDLNSAVRAVIDPARLTWVEESTTNRTTWVTEWVIRPDHYSDKLSSRGSFRIEPASEGSRRRATGEVKVNMFLVGGKVEGAIVGGMREHAEFERDAIVRHLQGNAGPSTG